MPIMHESGVKLLEKDRTVLRKLGEECSRIGNLPVQKEKAELWRRVNDQEAARPMVFINEEPWAELKESEEALACQCEDRILRSVEMGLRMQLYKWNHFPADMIVQPVIECSKVWHSTGIGISQQGALIHSATVTSQHFDAQIRHESDIKKILMPEVCIDEDASAGRLALLESIFDGVIPVVQTGIKSIWFTPWDFLIRLVSIENIMVDMIERPEFVEALVSHYVDAKMYELDQMEALGLFSVGAGNSRVGSGGYGHTRDLPLDDGSGSSAALNQLWGCGNAQIFSEVSPEMHWNFSLKHEMRWLDRWGLTYYGCCEPLHRKMDILRKIKNLRKISVSPWFDIPKGLEDGAGDYVLSVKPNPAIFAEDGFNEARARSEIRTLLDQAKGCSLELVMKDVSTVRFDPRRLWRWSEIAMEEVRR